MIYKCPDCGITVPETLIGQVRQVPMGHCPKCKGGAKVLIPALNIPKQHRCEGGYRPSPYEFAFTEHRHKCIGCGVVWHHDPAKIEATGDDASAFYRAHSCPGCGMNQQFTYDGPEPPQVCNWNGGTA